MVYKKPKFDLNKNPADFASNDELNIDHQFDDTALWLGCVGHGINNQKDAKSAPDDDCRLILGLGRMPSVCCKDLDLVLKLSLSTTSKSDVNPISNHHVLDEGSTSTKSSGGYMPSLLLAPRISLPLQKPKISVPESSVVSDFLRETTSDQRTSNKKCQFSVCANCQAGYCLPNGCGVRGSHSIRCSQERSGKKGVMAGCEKRPVAPWHTMSACGPTSCCLNHGGGKHLKFKNHTMRLNDSTYVNKGHDGFHGRASDPDPGSPDSHSLSCASTVSNSTSWLGKPVKRRQLIPPQVLVPSSMKSSSFLPFKKQSISGTDNKGGQKILEGRVHGGSLLTYLKESL